MNCDQFREVVHDVARDEGLGRGALNEALEHADRCAECDALLEKSEALTTNLHALAELHAAEEAPAHVEAALLRSFRQKRVPAPRSERKWLWSFVGLGAVAAAVLLMIVLVQHARQVLLTPSQAARAAVAGAPSASQPALLQEEEDASLAASLPEDLTDGWPFAFQDDAATDSFVPLTEAFDPTSLDLDSVMRVSMSRVQLQNLGVYLDAESDQPVVADLVVANDGTPQAIRVVSW